VWSFAVSVLELFMGRLPSRDEAAAADKLAAFRERGGVDPDIPALPEALADLLEWCLQPNPGERPSMKEVAHELEAIYERETGDRYPTPPAEEARLLAGELSNKALSMLDLGRPDDAERLWEEALGQDRHHPQATYDQGVYLWRAGRVTDAELVRRLEAVRVSNLAAWDDEYLVALVHLERGDVAAARELLEYCTAQAGDSPEIAELGDHVVTATERARCVRTVAGDERVERIALSDSGDLVAVSDRGSTRVLDVASGRCLQVLEDEADPAWSLALTSDGRFALRGSQSGTVRLWDVERGRAVRVLDAHTTTVEGVAVTRDLRHALT